MKRKGKLKMFLNVLLGLIIISGLGLGGALSVEDALIKAQK